MEFRRPRASQRRRRTRTFQTISRKRIQRRKPQVSDTLRLLVVELAAVAAVTVVDEDEPATNVYGNSSGSIVLLFKPPQSLLISPILKSLYWFTFRSHAFRISAPKIWNSLTPHILQSQTLSSFRRHLKTHYFQSAYPAP